MSGAASRSRRKHDDKDQNGSGGSTDAKQGQKTRTDTQRQGSGGHAASHNERRILQHGRSTLIGAIGGSLTTKSGSLFVLCAHNGDIDAELNGGYGLYFHDTRFLDLARLRLNGKQLSVLLSRADEGDRSICELTNPDLKNGAPDNAGHDRNGHAADGHGQGQDGEIVPKESIGVRRERVLAETMTERIAVHNFNPQRVTLTLELEFAAHYTNMFVVRGAEPGKRGTLHDPHWSGHTLTFRYDGADDRTRTTALKFDPAPDDHDGGRVCYALDLKAGATAEITITGTLRDEGKGKLESSPQTPNTKQKPFSTTTVTSNNALFDRVLDRAFADLRMLVSQEHGDTYFAAGVPWYVALFGRDSLITALQTIAYDPPIAANTLRVLASYQGKKEDDWRDEQPGKIPHELRVGEKAHLHEVPQTPYYGTVDATPLFVILAGEYLRWTGDRKLWQELRNNIDAALGWIDNYGDHDGDGFVDYIAKSSKGLSNQGWKDSGNSITNRDGSLATPPIALVEVQGYVYRAKQEAAWLHDLDGDHDRAEQLRKQAADLRDRFGKAYWMADRKFFAIALEKGGKQAQSLASNGGQALWSGIASQEHADAVADALMSEAMFSGWGVRTLGADEAAFNPIDYQVGSIWPHDNSLIAAGLKRYGHIENALRIFSAIFDAATNFDDYRLPEVFAGFSRKQYPVPVHYPVACSPQAWAAGALPYLLRTLLGLQPDAISQRLHIVKPALPSWLSDLTIHDLHVGEASVDLRFRRADDVTLVAVLDKHGPLDVAIVY